MNLLSKILVFFGIQHRGPDGSERRKTFRLSAHHQFKYKQAEGDKELTFLRNISAGGVLFFSEYKIPNKTLLEVEINFPHYEKFIKATVIVKRSRTLHKVGGYEVAAEFVDIDQEAKDFIEKRINIVVEKTKEDRKK